MKKWGLILLNNLPDMTSMELEPAAQQQLSFFSALTVLKTSPGYPLPGDVRHWPWGLEHVTHVLFTDLYAPGHTMCGL